MACLFLVMFNWEWIFSVSIFEFRKVVFEEGEYLFAGAEFGILDKGNGHEVLDEFREGFSVYVLLGLINPVFENEVRIVEGHFFRVG